MSYYSHITRGEVALLAIPTAIGVVLFIYLGPFRKKYGQAGIWFFALFAVGLSLSQIFRISLDSSDEGPVPEGKGMPIEVAVGTPSPALPLFSPDELAALSASRQDAFRKAYPNGNAEAPTTIVMQILKADGTFIYRTDVKAGVRDSATIFEGVSQGRSVRILCNYDKGYSQVRVQAACNDRINSYFRVKPFRISQQ